jgi:hypothetical protein
MFDPDVRRNGRCVFEDGVYQILSSYWYFGRLFDTFLSPSLDVWHSFVDDGAIYWGSSFVFLRHGWVGTSF